MAWHYPVMYWCIQQIANGSLLLTRRGLSAQVSYNGIEPNYQGILVLSLVPNPDYAVIKALEVVDQTQ